MNNRNKISSNWTDFIKRMQQDVERQEMSVFYEAFRKHFKDKTDFDNTIKKQPNSDKLIRIGFFYYWAKKQIKNPYIVLIAILSAMEAINTDKFMTFDEWLLSREGDEIINFPIKDKNSFKNEIKILQKMYFKRHGSARKVKNFIKNNFNEEDKKRLIKSIQIYNDKSKSYVNTSLNNIINILYQERSNFVHSATLPQISNNNRALIGNYKINDKNCYAKIKISSGLLEAMFERAFIKYLKQNKTPN